MEAKVDSSGGEWSGEGLSFLPSPTLIREDGWRQMLNLQDVQRSKLSLNPNQLNILLPF